MFVLQGALLKDRDDSGQVSLYSIFIKCFGLFLDTVDDGINSVIIFYKCQI
jgi:hypothetical protein